MKNKWIMLILFSIAMGFLEGAVVVYLRELLYPNGFAFPLAPVPDLIALTELIREASTIIMLVGIGFLCGKTKISRLAYFMISFAIWDLTYYVALKLILNWPESLLTWDILFLIPVPWIGPVIAPCIISCLMIVLGLFILRKEENQISTKFKMQELLLLFSGCAVILYSFMKDYIYLIRHQGFASAFWTPGSSTLLLEVVNSYVPVLYDWKLFAVGLLLILGGIFTYSRTKAVN